MPRIRTIKPEFCTSEQVAECSTTARLLFVTMWCFCDDAGRHPANVKRLKMECFPGDAFDDFQMRSFVDELIRVGLLSEYTHENVVFWQVTGWKHQKIDRPNYKYGPLDASGIPLPIDEHVVSIRRMLDDHSPPEGSLPEGKGVYRKGRDVCGVVDKSPTPPDDGSGYVFVVSSGQEWELSKTKLSEYRGTFPELDLDSELRRACQWLRDNPKRRKTPRGMHAFLGSWLDRSQNKGVVNRSTTGKKTLQELGL